MPLLAAFTLPHPPLAVPDVGRGGEQKIQSTLSAFDTVATSIAELKPDTIIFITPHNITYADYFHISPGNGANGDFSQFRAPDVKLNKTYDTVLIRAIEAQADAAGINAGTLGEKDSRLDHGVMVPMWFIDKRYDDYCCVRISQSGLPPEVHYRFGQCITKAVENTERNVVLIASGDLSHKLKHDGPYGFANEGPEYDKAVTDAFSAGNFAALFDFPEIWIERAGDCGYRSYLIMAGCFDKTAVIPKLLSYEGPFGVGYAVASFYPDGSDDSRNFADRYMEQSLKAVELSKQEEDAYRSLARKSLEHTICTNRLLKLSQAEYSELPPEMVNSRAGAFVSLHINGRLRGCIGTISPTTGSIADEIIQNAVSAGLHDNRFDPVTEAELPWLKYKVDILGDAEKIDSESMLDVKRYGVIVRSGTKHGLLLPNLEGVDTVEQQIAIARKKAGIRDHEKISLERFEVVRHE